MSNELVQNADFPSAVAIATERCPGLPSPQAGRRRLLDRVGGEVRARYPLRSLRTGSTFPRTNIHWVKILGA